MTKKTDLVKKKEQPSVEELILLKKALPSITKLDNKIKRESVKKNKNIEEIFNKKKKKSK